MPGDSSVLHCACLLCMIFASLARANERVYHQPRSQGLFSGLRAPPPSQGKDPGNEVACTICTYATKEILPQAKLDSEINVPFLLNKHGDLYFLSHKYNVHIILFD